LSLSDVEELEAQLRRELEEEEAKKKKKAEEEEEERRRKERGNLQRTNSLIKCTFSDF
jgi:hypothetical protein